MPPDRSSLLQGVIRLPPERPPLYPWEGRWIRRQVPRSVSKTGWLEGTEEDWRAAWLLAAGLYDLSVVTLPKGVTEVRIWHNIARYGFFGTIIQRRPNAFYGAQVARPEWGPPDQCRGWAEAIEPCVAWETLWQLLMDQGILDLPDATDLDGVELPIEDGQSYTVEVQIEGRYRTYEYSSPEHRPWPEARRMEAIASILRWGFSGCPSSEQRKSTEQGNSRHAPELPQRTRLEVACE